jgi:hypothetical protein
MGTDRGGELFGIRSAAGHFHQGVDLLGLVHQAVVDQVFDHAGAGDLDVLAQGALGAHVPEQSCLITDELAGLSLGDPELQGGDAGFDFLAGGSDALALLGEAQTPFAGTAACFPGFARDRPGGVAIGVFQGGGIAKQLNGRLLVGRLDFSEGLGELLADLSA